MTNSDLSTRPDRSTVLEAMATAGRAPSVHNTQPWRWVLHGADLRLYRDDSRLLEVADPAGRQLVISCGAMLHHVRTAFAAAGWHTDTLRVPDPKTPGWLATVEFRPWPEPPPGVLARAAAIARRRTDRLPMREPEHWDELLARLRMLVGHLEVGVDVLDDAARPRLAAASEHSAATQRYDMQYQSELHWWTAHSMPKEGIPREALASDSEAERTPISRAFPTVEHAPRHGDIEDRSRLLVLSTDADSVLDWLRVGEALSVVLLECTASGADTCALTHLTELPAARRVLSTMLSRPGVPQVVIRIGAENTGLDARMTPRRPVAEYLSVAD
ncbi:Acg family FMN-binding oxidoreductase [Nocardia takedensis]|uniref:Acg family FMN-binding oxidoreductase n=1 Tax=Nocardia takedensis TaxID=259390 RepID=UPI00031AC4BC|nr:hypothetical protein [Nocardia takedensis]